MKVNQESIRRLHDTAQFERHQLSNGLIVWLQKPAISISHEGYLSIFFKNVGSANDPPGHEGLAHFLEHMLFRASKACDSESELKKPIIENGGLINARTNNEITEYFIEIAQGYFKEAIKSLYELVGEAVFKSDHLSLERQVILREISERRIMGKNLTGQHAKELMFGMKDPFTHSIVGFPSSVEKINTEILHDFYEKNYHAGNANIICGGSFSLIPEALKLLEDTFGEIKSGMENRPVDSLGRCISSGRHEFSDKRYGVNEFSFGYVFPYMNYEDRQPLKHLMDALAGGSISPFVVEMREKRGLTYSINSLLISKLRGAFTGFECEIDPRYFRLAHELFLEKLGSIDAGCIEKYFLRIQRERLGNFQKPISACHDLADEIISCGRPYSFRESEDIIDSVKLEDMFAWCEILLKKEPLIMEFKKNKH